MQATVKVIYLSPPAFGELRDRLIAAGLGDMVSVNGIMLKKVRLKPVMRQITKKNPVAG